MIAQPPQRKRLFALFAALAIASKLALTSHIGILPIDAPYDETNYIWHALSIARGEWFGPYNEFTLIKMPFFPMFLAGIEVLHIPLPLAHQVLYCAAALAACLAVRPIIAGERTLCALFAFILFNPYTFDETAWLVERSQIVGSLALLSVAFACAMLVRRAAFVPELAIWAAALGVSFSAFWLTREESVWLVPCISILLAAYGFKAWRRGGPDALPKIALMLVAPALLGLSIAAVTIANARLYGWPTIVENGTPEFLGALDSLARIKQNSRDRLVPVPRASLTLAYSASSAARELRPNFSGPVGAGGIAISCTYVHECADIAGGWFIWILRDAVATSGNMTSASAARVFYVRLSREIDRACDAGTIPCGTKVYGMVPNVVPGDAPLLLRTFLGGVARFFTASGYELLPANPGIEPAADKLLYRAVTGDVVAGLPVPSKTDAVLSFIAAAYRATVPWLALLSAGCIVLRLAISARTRLRDGADDAVVIGTSVFASIAALIAILTVVQTFLFTAFVPEYFGSAYAILMLGTGVVLASEASRFRERARERVRPPAYDAR